MEGDDQTSSSSKSVIKLCLFVLHGCLCLVCGVNKSLGKGIDIHRYTDTHKQQESEGWMEGQTEKRERERRKRGRGQRKREEKKGSTWQGVLINEEKYELVRPKREAIHPRKPPFYFFLCFEKELRHHSLFFPHPSSSSSSHRLFFLFLYSLFSIVILFPFIFVLPCFCSCSVFQL